MLKIVIIGFGFAGKERLKAVENLQAKGYDCSCIGIYDPFSTDLKTIATAKNLTVFTSLSELISAKPDWAIISVPHQEMLSLCEPLLAQGIRILLEKPFGQSVADAQALMQQQQFAQQIMIGFNYRFYEGVQAAYRDLQTGYFGEVISINMTLGHGGRPGDEQTWKLNPEACGGGCLLDPGIHLFDLVHRFTQQPIRFIGGSTWRGFWGTGIEEEASLLLNSGSTIINITTSLMRWRNTFKIEINGTEHYGIITGRSRHYGRQCYTRGKRWGWQQEVSQAESEDTLISVTDENSFTAELEDVFFKTKLSAMSACSASEGLQAMKTWEFCRDQLALSDNANPKLYT